ncbi:host cell division inhibitor Icd-like protein [Citrobacter sedlakii]|uniref:host cell division inhibitor Icd-like protein n=1 Tax=Citrobacter sedlakii TaxID=67826 RepID=UPI0031394A9B
MYAFKTERPDAARRYHNKFVTSTNYQEESNRRFALSEPTENILRTSILESGWLIKNITLRDVNAVSGNAVNIGASDRPADVNAAQMATRYLTEVAIMATVPALSHPEFTFVFLAVRRTDRDARPRPVRVIADCEHAARLKLATEFILSFAARIPLKSAGEVVA